tara:strand:+ start:844 stop:1818 length:975 start_codon:yes stop_codon:yes gene_type:complete
MLNPSAYEQISDSSDESDDSDDYYGRDYTNNLGFHEKHRKTDGRFINNQKYSEYSEIRNELFTPKIRRDRILVDSSNHATTNKNEYVVHFDQSKDHATEGYGVFKNVIGFNVVSCCIPNIFKTIHSNNNKLIVEVNSVEKVIELTINTYTIETLIVELQGKLNDYFTDNSFSITVSPEDILTVTNDQEIRLKFSASKDNEQSTIHSLLGFAAEDTPASLTHTGKQAVKLNTAFIDLVIPELPYVACKKNPTSKKIVERICITSDTDKYIFHTPEQTMHQHYFTPITLHRITIQLHDELKNIPHNSLDDNSFEFEIITLHNTDIL